MNDWWKKTCFRDVLDCEGVVDAGEFMAVGFNDERYRGVDGRDIDGLDNLFYLTTGQNSVFVWDNDLFRRFIDAVRSGRDAEFGFEGIRPGQVRKFSFKNGKFSYPVFEDDRHACDSTVGFTDLLVERLERCYQTIEERVGKRDARIFQRAETTTKYIGTVPQAGLLGVCAADLHATGTLK